MDRRDDARGVPAMAFPLKPDESLRHGICRVARRRLRHAIECLEDGGKPEVVHVVRRDLKKARALLRFVAAETPPRVHRRAMMMLRHAAANLGPARDAYVRQDTLRGLAKGSASDGVFGPIAEALRAESEAAQHRLEAHAVPARTALELRRAIRVVKQLTLERDGWSAVCDGLTESYRRARLAYRAAGTSPTAERLHLWRKRTKDLALHLRFLRSIGGGVLEQECRRLVETLGEHHDLAVLQDWADDAIAADPPAVEQLTRLAGPRERKLRAAAFSLGARLFRAKPRVFAERFKPAWKARGGQRKAERVRRRVSEAAGSRDQ